MVNPGVAAKDCGDNVNMSIAEVAKEVSATNVTRTRLEIFTAIASSLYRHSNF